MTPEIILSVVQIIAAISSVVFIFIGLRMALKKLDKDNSAQTIPPDIIKKSTRLILIGILFFALFRFAANYFPMKEDQFEESMILIQSLWQATYMIGFTAFIPYILNKLQSGRTPPPTK
ncbi:MAG: hypothetical protein GXY43_00475 [Clostridiaceae bacterium]|nr:hypothetical protein [Clostridiaceae bacterium]